MAKNKTPYMTRDQLGMILAETKKAGLDRRDQQLVGIFGLLLTAIIDLREQIGEIVHKDE